MFRHSTRLRATPLAYSRLKGDTNHVPSIYTKSRSLEVSACSAIKINIQPSPRYSTLSFLSTTVGVNRRKYSSLKSTSAFFDSSSHSSSSPSSFPASFGSSPFGSYRSFTTSQPSLVPPVLSPSTVSTPPTNFSVYETYTVAAKIIVAVTGKDTNERLSKDNRIPSSSTIIGKYFQNDEAKAIRYAHTVLTELINNHQYLPALNRLGRWALFGIYGEPRNIRTAIKRLYTVAQTDLSVIDKTVTESSSTEENELIKSSVREACYWYAHAWTKMTDMAAEENILLQNTQQLSKDTNVNNSGNPSVSASTTGCQGNGSCGGTGQCGNTDKKEGIHDNASSASSSPSSGCGSGGCGSGNCGSGGKTAPSATEISAEEVAEKEKQRAEAAKNVMAEIRRFRKRAIANKVRRTQGLPLLDGNSTATVSSFFSTKNTDNTAKEDPMTLPLKTNEIRAEKYFLKAALLDYEDSQVALGNLCMRVSTEANPRVYEAIGWYELAAKVAPSLTYAHTMNTQTKYKDSTVGTNTSLQSKPIYNFAETTVPSSSSSSSSGTEIFTSSNPSYNEFLQHDSLPHPDAVYNLGMIYWEGIEGFVTPDPSKALSFFETGSTLQDISSLYFLGVLYMNGNPKLKILPNVRRGLRLIELSASQGHHQAALFLAQFWRTGKPKQSIEPDIRRSVYFLELAGNTYEDTDALAELGDGYYHGTNGFTKDLYKAFMYYEKAAKQGHMHAAVCTGSMYFHGMGIPQNYSTAAYFYKLAGERGSPEGWRNLASLHAMGQGVVKDMETAKGLIALANKLETELNQHQQQLLQAEGEGTCSTTGEVIPEQGCGKTGGCGCKSN